MEGPMNAQRVDRSSQNVLLQHGKLTEGQVDKRKVDGCLQKVLLLHNS